MPSTSSDVRLLDDFSEATKEFLFYFREALKYLAPISEQDEEATILSTGAQELIEEILQGLRWFRNRNQASALQLGDLDLRLASLQVTTKPVEPHVAWHQSLTIDNIKEKIGEASQVYGQEGLDMLSQLQVKIMKLHKEAIRSTEVQINARLILEDRNETRQEDRQVFYENVEVPVPEPSGDIVTVCLSICLTVVKPFAKVFCKKKARGCSREIEAMQVAMQADKARLRELKTQGDGIKKANAAIGNCPDVLKDMEGSMFTSLTQQAKIVSEPGQPINQLSLDVLRSNLGKTVMAEQYLNVQLDEFLIEIESPESGIVRSPTVIRIKEFHNKTKEVSKYVESLGSAKNIVREKHRDNFVENVAKVSKELAEILDKVKNMFAVWSRYAGRDPSETIFFSLKKEAEEVTRSFIPFDREIRKSIQEITRILEKRDDKANSKWLQKYQKDGDRVLDGTKWAGRPLSTTLEAKEVVQKLEDINNAIYKILNEVMPPLLEYGGDRNNLPNGERSGREALQAVPESLLSMISTALQVENSSLKGLGGKDSAHA